MLCARTVSLNVALFLLVSVFTLGAVSDPALANDPKKLRITLQLPITNHIGQNLLSFKEKFEAATMGRYEVEIFDRAQLYRDTEVVEAVRSGKIEMGVVKMPLLRKFTPVADVFGQPFLFNFDALLFKAYEPTSPIRQTVDLAVRATAGVVPLWWQPYGASVIFSRGIAADLPEKIQRRKIRVFSDAEGELIKACGGVPLRFSDSKQHQAMKDGAVEMSITAVVGVKARKLWEVSDTITRTLHSSGGFMVIINADTLKSMREDDRRILTTLARKVETEVLEKFASVEKDAYEFAKSKNMKIVNVTLDGVAKWRACSTGVFDEFVSRTGEIGQRLMQAYAKLRLDPCCSKGPAGQFTLR